MREPAEMLGRLLRRLADDRHVQTASDHTGDFAERHALFGNGMIHAASGTLLEHQSIELRRIEPVHRGPPVASLADIGGGTLVAGDADQDRNGRGKGEIADRGTRNELTRSASSFKA
jgi:hypothetical protein